MPESTRSRRWLGIVSERHSNGHCTNSALVTDTEREMRQLVADAASDKETKEVMMSGNMWIVTCQFDMDSELPAPFWAVSDEEEEYYYDEYDRLNDMGEWVSNFYEWLGDWEDDGIIEILEQWLAYMTAEGASYGVNIHNMSSQPLLDWYVAGWGGRYVKKAG